MSKQATQSQRREKGSRGLAVGVSVVLWFLCATYVYPFVWMFYNSFKTEAAYRSNPYNLPLPPTVQAYQSIFARHDVYLAFLNSLFNTVCAIVGIVVLSFLVAYFLGRYRFRGRTFLYGFFMAGLFVPGLGLLIPSYIQFHTLGMIGHWYTLLLPYITGGIPTAIYLFDSYIRTIPRSLEEAAHMDGATITDIIRLIMFPMCLPMTATIVVINFLGYWNEFPLALLMQPSPKFRTMTVWLSMFQSMYEANLTGKLTAMFILTLPVIITYFLFREQMMRGLASGAIKG
ncbi:MAG TPA: carbohydrate ABC transporter permease [Spirochaetia bacterium]|nr:carbohydrate ABC transporter permease [Spirochaetia bacterium]